MTIKTKKKAVKKLSAAKTKSRKKVATHAAKKAA